MTRPLSEANRFPELRGHGDEAALGGELPRRLETGDADFLVEVARAASLFGHVQRIDAFPRTRADDQGGLPDGPVGVGLAVLVKDELRGKLLARDGVAVGAGGVVGKRLQYDALHVAGVAEGRVAEGEEHVPARVAGEVGVGEAVNLRAPRAAHARVAESLDRRVSRAVVGDALRAVCRREAGERVGRQHAHLRGPGLREVELAVMAEEPRVGAGLPEKGGVKCFDCVGEDARTNEERVRNWKEALHGAILPRTPILCKRQFCGNMTGWVTCIVMCYRYCLNVGFLVY